VAVAEVVQIRTPSEIAEVIVQGIAVKMPALLARGPGAAKRIQDERMNAVTLTNPI
jgi:hypothetical protein